MVLTGQFLERPALIDAGGVTLEGLYHRGDRSPALLLCPPLGNGGGMDAPPLAEMAWAAARAGHPSLRFQHRGEGASGGRSDPERALDDAEAARRHLAESAPACRVAVAGLGSGCETALGLAARRKEISRAVLVAPERLPSGASPVPALALLPEEGCRLSPEELRALLAPAGGLVEVISGADPLFRAGLRAMGRRALEWIARAAR